MDNDNSSVTKQLHEIDKSLTAIYLVALFIAIIQMNSCLNAFGSSGRPIEVHVNNMSEAHP
jgi:hypothetical protein